MAEKEQPESGLRIRLAQAADAEAIAHVHMASWRSTYRGIVPDDILANLSEEDYERRWRQRLAAEEVALGTQCIFVADIGVEQGEDENAGIIGFAHGGPVRPPASATLYDAIPRVPCEGELYAIYLLASAQRRGVGRRLVSAIARNLVAQGLHGLLIWALADNPACGFYEALGGRVVAQQSIEIGKSLLEVAYGWPDTLALASQPS